MMGPLLGPKVFDETKVRRVSTRRGCRDEEPRRASKTEKSGFVKGKKASSFRILKGKASAFRVKGFRLKPSLLASSRKYK